LESLTLVELILDLQEALGVRLTDDELRGLRTFQEAVDVLARKVDELGAEKTPLPS
jgi:acyl carrier protein